MLISLLAGLLLRGNIELALLQLCGDKLGDRSLDEADNITSFERYFGA